MTITIKGKPAGTATISHRLLADGSKIVELRLDLSKLGKKVRVTSQSTFDAKGMPVRKFLETIVPGGEVQQQTVVSFNKDGASAVVLNGDSRHTKRVPLVPIAPRASLSEFWFLRDRPLAGATEKTYVFHVDSLEWEITTTTYLGPKTVTIKGHKIAAHELETESNSRTTHAFVDAKGLPLLIEDGTMKMERVFDK